MVFARIIRETSSDILVYYREIGKDKRDSFRADSGRFSEGIVDAAGEEKRWRT